MKLSRRDAQAFAALDALYARLPTIACQRKCSFACGAIPLTDLEARRLQLAARRKPRTIPVTMLPPGEARERTVERCIYLRGEACGVYDVRPMICRIWGLVKTLSCPHGCVPSRWVSDLEFLELARAVERIGGGRILRTAPEGLTLDPTEKTFESVAAAAAVAKIHGYARSVEEIDADAERTRNLRALFGGRIIRAMGKGVDDGG